MQYESICFCLQSYVDGFLLKVKLKAIKEYQLFESCSKNEGTIECQLSGLTDSVTYDDDLLKHMIVQAQQISILLKPKQLYKKRLGLRDIKAMGLRELC